VKEPLKRTTTGNGAISRLISSRFRSYRIVAADVATIDRLARVGGVSGVTIDESVLAQLEESRPGYGRVARHYLTEGHFGVGIVVGSQIAAIGWIYPNASSVGRPVSYYQLPPRTAWFHADWTHPLHRGRGLHRETIRLRAQWLSESEPAVQRAEANITTDNVASLRNYAASGFTDAGVVRALHLGALSRSWRSKSR
jgi:hypothetical protein